MFATLREAIAGALNDEQTNEWPAGLSDDSAAKSTRGFDVAAVTAITTHRSSARAAILAPLLRRLLLHAPCTWALSVPRRLRGFHFDTVPARMVAAAGWTDAGDKISAVAI